MKNKGNAITEGEQLKNLTVKGDTLYWNGKRIKTGGFSKSEIISLFGVLLTSIFISVIVLSNLGAIKNSICELSGYVCKVPVTTDSSNQ